MLNMAIAKLIHEERQREIEQVLRARGVRQSADESTAAARDVRDGGRNRHLASRQETAGAAS
jgi:hypothetical protein